MVSYKECHAGQHLVHRELAFTHKSACFREGAGQYPHLEILKVLKMVYYADQALPDDTTGPASTPHKTDDIRHLQKKSTQHT
ncbi:hypothetical protein AO388_26020 [Pseudomonas sp. ICMP 10191]|nr:hypothetical protein AO388_26015 [Pseudomonas sp. ICMP 10191]KTB95999.1 hypothetical protein AO388_26020 [Pseudomonas sp. ICMP 10191]